MRNDPSVGRKSRRNFLPNLSCEELGINIFKYMDFIQLLEAYFRACKERDSRYSYRYFSKRLGKETPSFVAKFLTKKQKVSEDIFNILLDLFALKTADELEYFEVLHRLEHNPEGTTLYTMYYKRYKELRLKKPVSIEEAQIECATSWDIQLIRDMAALKGAQRNPMWFKKCIHPKLGLNVPDIEMKLKILEEAELLEVTEEGFNIPDPLQKMNPKDPRLKTYYRDMLDISKIYLNEPKKDRRFGAFNISTSREKFEKLKEDLKQFLEKQFEELDTSSNEDEVVVSFSYQLFKLAEIAE